MRRRPLIEIPKTTRIPKKNESKTSVTRGLSVKNLPKWSSAKVMIKAKYASKNLVASLHYMQHREKDTPKRELITKDGSVKTKDFIKEMNASGKKFYKLILSPEDGLTKEELKKTVKNTMDELEKLYGKLIYAFVIHENTQHLHAHMILSARSKNKANIKLGKNMLFKMKESAINEIWEIKQNRSIDFTQAVKNIVNSLIKGGEIKNEL